MLKYIMYDFWQPPDIKESNFSESNFIGIIEFVHLLLLILFEENEIPYGKRSENVSYVL